MRKRSRIAVIFTPVNITETNVPIKNVRGIALNYETFGSTGPWLALSPGGRRGMQELFPLAEKLAAGGHRVLLHDRRNCGGSEVEIAGQDAEYEIWADDLNELLRQLDATPAYVGGSSSGCRLALVLALRHPEAVRALTLWRVTGGGRACERLAEKYYGLYISAAKDGGMQAVCETEEFAQLISARPANRAKLMNQPPAEFIAVMQAWSNYFSSAADLPLIGATETDLRGLQKPALVIPGNDNSHPRQIGERVAALLPMADLQRLSLPDRDVDVSPESEWDDCEDELLGLLQAFVGKTEATHGVAVASAAAVH